MSSDTPKPRRTLSRPPKPVQPDSGAAPSSSSPRNTPLRSKGNQSHAPAGKGGAPMRSVRSNVWRADAPARPAAPEGRFGRDEGGMRGERGERAPFGARAERSRPARPEGDRPQRSAWSDRPARPPRARDDDATPERRPRTERPLHRNRDEPAERRPRFPGERRDDAGRRPRFQHEGRPERSQGARPDSREMRPERPFEHEHAPRRTPLPAATRTLPGDIAPARPQPQPVAAHAEGMRLNKRLAELGLCSRREADEWIARGWVLVNGQRAETGRRVGPDDSIDVEQAARGEQAQRVTILMHKPVGYVSGQPEDGYQSAASLINARSRWREDRHTQRFSPQQLRGLAPAGRLDIDSTGLLVLTQDGRVARQLIGEDSTVDKEYLVRVEYDDGRSVVSENVEAVFPPDQLALLRHGLSLDGQPLLPAQVDWQNPEQLRFVLVEGKKRQIRRMCEAVGLKVVGLKRIRIGRVMLGHLPLGEWRYLGPGEGF